MTFLFDNESLYDFTMRQLGQKSPKYADLNKIVAQAMCGATASMRFPGQLNSDLRKMGVNLVPFPRLHFFSCAFAPFTSTQGRQHAGYKIPDVATQLFNPSNVMVACDPRLGKYLTAFASFRGADMSGYEIEEASESFRCFSLCVWS